MTTGQVLNLLLHKFRVNSNPLFCLWVSQNIFSIKTICIFVHQGREQIWRVCSVYGARVWRWVMTFIVAVPWEGLCFYFLRMMSFVFSRRNLKEKTRLRDDEYPLVTRVLHGPCEKISKILITEADLGEEVTYDVSLGLLSPLSPFPRLVRDLWLLFLFLFFLSTHNSTMGHF